MNSTTTLVFGLGLLGLTACGSSTEPQSMLPSPPPPPVPAPAQSATPFAALQSAVSLIASKAPASNASVTESKLSASAAQKDLSLIDAGASVGLQSTNVAVVNTTTGDNQVEIIVNGVTFVATGATDTGNLIFSSKVGAKMAELVTMSELPDVALEALTITDGDKNNESLFGFAAMGAPTDLSVIDGRVSRGDVAFYHGDASLVATRNDGVVDTANRPYDATTPDNSGLVLVVNFGASTLSGGMNLSSKAPSGDSTFEVKGVVLSIPDDSPFTGSSFSTPLKVTTNTASPNLDGSNQLGIDPTLTVGTLNGSFFGANGASVGGDFQISGPTPGGANTIVVQGGFIGKE